jgi:hypothetical protein
VGTCDWDDGQKDYFTQWQAGFIEDAYALHLVSKPMFAAVVRTMLDEPEVARAFVNSTVDGAAVLAKIQKRIEKAAPRPATPAPPTAAPESLEVAA